MYLNKKFASLHYLAIFSFVVSFLTRIVLIFNPITQTNLTLLEISKIFFLGFASDFFVFTISVFFTFLYLIFISNGKYKKPYGYIIFGILLSLYFYVTFGNTILNEYGGVLPEIGMIFIGIKTLFFGLLLFLPQYRYSIRLILFVFCIFLDVFLILLNAFSEYFFWNEFGVRFNFIAVDYLIYTNEVIGNTMQSYPVTPIFSTLFIITAAITYFIVKKSKSYLQNIPTFKQKIYFSLTYITLVLISIFTLPYLKSKENSKNIFVNELQANGLYSWFLAFKNSELDFYKFYKTLPQKEAFAILKQQILDIDNENILRKIKPKNAEIHKNVVLITIESFSADFMKAYGNKQNITPFLDSLSAKSLFFTNLYAVGNRTVRGLEAVTLCLPPSAGESIIKRSDNKNKFTTGSIFKQKKYEVKYFYGGDAFFDNMESFFGGNGYNIVDKKTFDPEEITFSNVWGVCDEDMANKAIKIMNQEAQTNQPFFNHWMTVSNHRPFTFPEGKIQFEGNQKNREACVKYTDYALKRFFDMASKTNWFKNTVFVIISDHCASSAGKTELPLDKYRIPAMIYSPGFIQPQQFNKLMSQIDIMPTVFGLLNFNYESKFFGQDVFNPDYKPRALIATYQDLGLIKNNTLTIISPKKTVKQYELKLNPEANLETNFQLHYNQIPIKNLQENLVNETISYYQTSASIIKNKKYEALKK